MLWLYSPDFLDVGNLLERAAVKTSINAVIAMGMTFVIITAGIDLPGRLRFLRCAGAFAASLIASGNGLLIAMPIVLLAGLVLGAVSKQIITHGAVQPFIATLVSMTVLRGRRYRVQQRYADRREQRSRLQRFGTSARATYSAYRFRHRGRRRLRRMRWVALTQTRFGRYVYAIGGNENVTPALA